jgi:hypothetical protein
MKFPPCEDCGAEYAEGAIGTAHNPGCQAGAKWLEEYKKRNSPEEVSRRELEYMKIRELKRIRQMLENSWWI